MLRSAGQGGRGIANPEPSAVDYPFTLVDVFGAQPLTGNPLAVVHDAGALDTEQMLRITRWLNFSETTFLVPPTDPAADYQVRIFTPDRELPFAGHPTLGTCRAWLSSGGAARDPMAIVQQCGAGLVTVRRDGEKLAFAAPPLLRDGPVDETKVAEVVDFLNIDRSIIVDIQWVDNGPGWIAVLLASAEAVLKVIPAARRPSRIDVGLVAPHAPDGPADFELRAFFTDQAGNVREDPVTGSLNASIAQWLFASGRATDSYVASQGTAIGRAGRIGISRDAEGQVWVAGAADILSSGVFHL